MRLNALFASVAACMLAATYAVPVAQRGDLAVAARGTETEKAIAGGSLQEREISSVDYRATPSWKYRDAPAPLMTAPGWKR